MKNTNYIFSYRTIMLLLLISYIPFGFSQSNRPKLKNDTVFMTYYGKDVTNSNYNPTAKIEAGILLKGKKESLWTKYYPDGKTPKIYNRISRLDNPRPVTSQLDRDGKTPKKYQDNLPR